MNKRTFIISIVVILAIFLSLGLALFLEARDYKAKIKDYKMKNYCRLDVDDQFLPDITAFAPHAYYGKPRWWYLKMIETYDIYQCVKYASYNCVAFPVFLPPEFQEDWIKKLKQNGPLLEKSTLCLGHRHGLKKQDQDLIKRSENKPRHGMIRFVFFYPRTKESYNHYDVIFDEVHHKETPIQWP